MLKVLITGTTGMLGRFLLERYSRCDQHCITGLDHGDELAGARENLFDVAIHCASPHTSTNIRQLLSANVDILQDVIRVAKKTVYISSGEAIQPTLYGAAKRCGEAVCLASGKETRIIRLFHCFGPTIRLDRDDRVYACWLRAVLDEGKTSLKIPANASSIYRSFLSLEEFAQAVDTVVANGQSGKIYDCGGKYSENIKHCAEWVAKKYDIPLQVTPEMSKVAKVARPNNDKLMNLGWEPTRSFSDIFNDTYLAIQLQRVVEMRVGVNI